MKKGKVLFIFVLFSIFISMLCAKEMYPFAQKNKEMQFLSLTQNLRCLVCQNQNLAESNAGLAEDLRREIYQQILANHSNEEIIHYLTKRYGDYILYQPRLKRYNLILWFAPVLFLFCAFVILIFYIKKHYENNE